MRLLGGSVSHNHAVQTDHLSYGSRSSQSRDVPSVFGLSERGAKMYTLRGGCQPGVQRSRLETAP